MEKYYFKDQFGKKVFVEVTKEQKEELLKLEKEQRRTDDYFNYHMKSLDELEESGKVFLSQELNAEEKAIEDDLKLEDRSMIKKLKEVMPQLTKLQKQTLYKMCVEGKTQVDIAREEGIAKQQIYKRIQAIRKKVEIFLQNHGD